MLGESSWTVHLIAEAGPGDLGLHFKIRSLRMSALYVQLGPVNVLCGGLIPPQLKKLSAFSGERFLVYLRLSGEGHDSERLGTTD